MRTLEVPIIQAGPVFGAAKTIEIPDELALLDANTPPEDHGCMRVITKNDGDKRVVWNRKSISEIRAAEQMFDKLLAEGQRAFRCDSHGKRTEQQMTKFDPTAQEIIFVPMPAVAGG